jgi:hypothetical protein
MRTTLIFWTTIAWAAAGCGSTPEPGTPPPMNTQDAGGGPPDNGVVGVADSGVNNPPPDSGMNNPLPDSGIVEADSGIPQPMALGCRNVSVRTGEDGDEVDNSVFYTTAFNSPTTDLSEFIDAKGWQIGGPLRLCAGAIAADKAALTLESDVTFAVSLPLDNCLCRTYLASGSTGTLYCGASAELIDFKLTIDSMGDAEAGPVMVVGGPSAVPGEGHVRMTFQSKATSISAAADVCTPAMCAGALGAEEPNPTDYSTATGVSEVTNARQGSTISITAVGKPFDDDPMDGTADCEDWMNMNVKGALAGAPGFDFDNDQVGNPKDVVTIERIAE